VQNKWDFFFIDSTLFLRFYVTLCLNDGNKCQLGMETELGDDSERNGGSERTQGCSLGTKELEVDV
jgi:hypothetical protein